MRRIALVFASMVLLLLAVLLVLVVALDRGMLDRAFARTLSARFHRKITFTGLQARLLSSDPSLTVRGLVIENPERLNGGDLAEVRWLRLSFDRWALLHGSFRLRTITAHGVNLHLLRFGPMNNNWTFTSSPGFGPAFAPLRRVTRLAISDSRVDIRDYDRKLQIAGTFGQDTTGVLPFYFSASGTLAGFPVAADIRSGQLHGEAVGRPWPLAAHIVDGATEVHAHGTTSDAFNVSAFDLDIAAQGPNLADLGYLFHLLVPNSPPYRLHADGRSDGAHFVFSKMTGVIGQSDIRGWIRSDHSRARRRILAAFISRQLDRNDVEALLAPIPSRAAARAASGGVKVTAGSRWILPDAPFGLSRIREADFDFSVRAGSIAHFALPLRNVATDVTLENGVLSFAKFASDLYGGRLDGTASLDARPDMPQVKVAGRLQDARLTQTLLGDTLGGNARLDLTVDVAGTGRSIHDAAGRASGTVAVSLKGGEMSRRAAWIMGGDLLRALGASGNATATLPLTCAAIDLRGSGGPFALRGFKVETPLGVATGSGSVDFGSERMDILVSGHPFRKRLFQVATPLQIRGPLMKLVVTVLPADHARKLGLKGKLGIILSPVVGLLPLGHMKLPAASADVECR